MGYILADVIMGIYHWIKDTYFGPFTPIIGKLFVWGSRLHHIRPKYVTEFLDRDLFFDSAKWTALWIGPLIYYLGFNPFLISLFTIIAINDIIHKYAHMSDQKRPYWASFLQKIYIFQSRDEHHLHHTYPYTTHYCPITPFVNVIFEKIQLWRKIEGQRHSGRSCRVPRCGRNRWAPRRCRQSARTRRWRERGIRGTP